MGDDGNNVILKVTRSEVRSGFLWPRIGLFRTG